MRAFLEVLLGWSAVLCGSKGARPIKKGSNPLFVMHEKQTCARARANSVPMVLFSFPRTAK
jgi:hypothetical protein